ncbi:clavesin-1-like isoform X2 [Belonocnema kinseyi]|uniref:clavesin-1-like isoform X2 n=1 Tax=Belonocnema kinseyi TaxID=2817044 RepID=UPI00143D55D6|nr:clavesin-1-like isoform X2 [Belonocnema kinseyi]
MVTEVRMTKLKDPIPSIMIGDFLVMLDIDPPSPEFQEMARKELRESPEVQKEAMSRLQELLKAETDLHCPLENDAWLIRFLRPSKYYPESACKLVKRYYSFKAKHPIIYANLTPSNERNIFEQDILSIMPSRDQYGRRILILEIGKKWKVHKCSLYEIIKGCILHMEAAILEPATQIAGAVLIFDLGGFSLQQAMQFTPSFAKILAELLQDAIPLRIRNIHVINQPYIVDMVFTLFKPFIREKSRSKIVFHGTNQNSLHQYIAPNYLPQNYGGTSKVPRVSGRQYFQLLVMGDKEYEAINSYGYNKK